METLVSSYRRNKYWCVSCMPLGSVTKQSLKHQPLKILLVFLCEAIANQLQQLNGCYGVSQVLGSVQRKKSSTRSSPIGDWSKGSTISWYFGIGLVVVKFLILITSCSWLMDSWEWWPENYLMGFLLYERLSSFVNKSPYLLISTTY